MTTKIPAELVSDQVLSRKNLVINGDMRVAQRATSATLDQDDDGYNVCDRFYYEATNSGGITMSQSTDVPTGEGFANSTKLACSTADTSVAAGDYVIVGYHLEGKDVQQLKYGTSSAESLTLSFWVKGNASATYVVEFINQDTSPRRSRSNTFSVTSSWSKVEITISGDTASGKTFNNDTGTSFGLFFWLMAGSTYSGGTLHTGSWQDMVNNERAGGADNILSSTSNELYVTGVQFEVGSTATAFDHRSYGEEFQDCKRYFERLNYVDASVAFNGNSFSANGAFGALPWTVQKRGTPSVTLSGVGQSSGQWSYLTSNGGYPSTTGSTTAGNINTHQCRINATGYAGLTDDSISGFYCQGASYIDIDAELS
tara:strand:- start:806 stop:1915 length:1110 start_codon:yes stop_codon:yes gene_type:complete